MPRINIHLDPETARRMQRAARTAGLSRSRWIANLVRAKVSCEWPESVVRLAGASDRPPVMLGAHDARLVDPATPNLPVLDLHLGSESDFP